MSNSQETPPDSWDMEPNDTSQVPPPGGISAVTNQLSALNVNAIEFIPGKNPNATSFVPSSPMLPVPPPNPEMLPTPNAVSGVPSTSVVPLNSATSTHNGKT